MAVVVGSRRARRNLWRAELAGPACSCSWSRPAPGPPPPPSGNPTRLVIVRQRQRQRQRQVVLSSPSCDVRVWQEAGAVTVRRNKAPN